MKADLVGDVGDFVRVVYSLFLDLQRMDGGVATFWLVIDGLGQVTLENLHDTVSIGVIVNQAAFAGVPDDEDQVRFAIDVVDNVPRIAPGLVCTSVTLPVLWIGSIFCHDGFDLIGVDMGRVDTRRGTQVLANVAYEMAKRIVGYGRFASGTTV